MYIHKQSFPKTKCITVTEDTEEYSFGHVVLRNLRQIVPALARAACPPYSRN